MPDTRSESERDGADVMARYGLTRVINASGTMTSLGASLVVPEAVAAGAEIQNHFVRIDELQAKASAVIARLTGAEAGCVTACSGGAMTVAAAACMTGSDLARIERLPDTEGLKDQVVMQAGHMINYGAPVDQAVRVAGAEVVPVGTAAGAEPFHLHDRLSEHTAAALYVVSHHTVGEGEIALPDFVTACHGKGVPVIVDMASEYDLTGPIALGADLVIYSSHKFLGGPTGGLIAGRKELVRACYLQNRGPGRLMKVGKEGILGALAALEAWERRDHAAVRAREGAVVEHWMEILADLDGIALAVVPDWTGNPIDRVQVTVDPEAARITAWELADLLAAGEPAVVVRDDLVEQGHFFLDPCNLKPGEEKVVSERISTVLARALSEPIGRLYGTSERRRRAVEAALRWPD